MKKIILLLILLLSIFPFARDECVMAAIVEGTNAGFVITAPSADPEGSDPGTVDTRSVAYKVVAPSDCDKIIELGWYCDNATEAANYDIGIYSHDAEIDCPGDHLGVNAGNAKGTSAGWKRVAGLDITVVPETTYWLAVQCDDTVTATDIDAEYDEEEEQQFQYRDGQTSLVDPWGNSDYEGNLFVAIYALYSTPVGTIHVRTTSGTIKIKREALTASHKLRVRVGATTYGIPLVAIDDPDASPIRIYDGSSIKALLKID